MFTNLPSNLKGIAALETAKRLSLRLKTLTMAVLRLLMSLLLVETQFRASDPVVDMVVVVVGMEAAAAAEDEVVEATEVVEDMEVVAAGMGVEVMAAVGEEVVVEDTEGVVAVAVGMAEVAVEVVIVAGSRGIWPGTVHKVAVAVEVVEGMVVEAAVEEVEEGVTTVAVLAILPGSVLIVDVDFRVWSGNSKKET